MELRHSKGTLTVKKIGPHDSDELRLINISISGPRGGRWGEVAILPQDADALAEALRNKESAILKAPRGYGSTTTLAWTRDEAYLLKRSSNFREFEGATLDPEQAQDLAESLSPRETKSTLEELI